MLRVALCTDGVFPHAMGGMQRHSCLLAEHLSRLEGVALTVLHPHSQQVFDPGSEVTEVHVPGIDPRKFYLRELWRYSGRIAKELDVLRPDVVLSQGFCVWQGIGRFSDRLVVHPHGLEMFQGITARERLLGAPFRSAMRHIVRRSARAVSLGGGLTVILEGLVRGSSARVAEVPNAVEVPGVPAPYPVANGPLELLFVGRFAFNKGIDLLMDVARALEAGDMAGRVRFSLAGDGPLFERYRAMGLPANVRMLGRVDDEALFKLYEACHALVLPTRFEGMPTVVLETMARARPVMVSDVGATAVLVDATNGYLLPKGDATALHDAIKQFVEMPQEHRAAMGMASYRKASDRFAWPVVARDTLALLREVANEAL